MRIALITLAVAALAFIGGIIWKLAQQNGIELIPETKTPNVKISEEATSLEILRSQWKTEDRIKTLEAKIDALTNATSPNAGEIVKDQNSPGNVKNTNTASGSIIPISAKFLTKIITKVNLTITKNNGIFGLYTFDTNTEYSTYTDPKYGITIIASRTPYTTWLKNFQAMDAWLYSVNETKTFPFPSFYINSTKPDTIIRLAIQVEAQTLLVSIPKSRFNEFKTLMNKK